MAPERLRTQRRFTSEDAQDIFKRAVELQQRAGRGPTEHLSSGELEQIAAEAGIDAAYIRQAIGELSARTERTDWWQRLRGGPTHLLSTRVVEGEVPDRAHGEMVDAIRRKLGATGDAHYIGRSLEWVGSFREPGELISSRVSVAIVPRDRRTTFRAEAHLEANAGWTFGLALAWVALQGTFLALGVGLGAPWHVGLALVGGVAARAGFRATVRSRTRKMGVLLDWLEGLAVDAVNRSRTDE